MTHLTALAIGTITTATVGTTVTKIAGTTTVTTTVEITIVGATGTKTVGAITAQSSPAQPRVRDYKTKPLARHQAHGHKCARQSQAMSPDQRRNNRVPM